MCCMTLAVGVRWLRGLGMWLDHRATLAPMSETQIPQSSPSSSRIPSKLRRPGLLVHICGFPPAPGQPGTPAAPGGAVVLEAGWGRTASQSPIQEDLRSPGSSPGPHLPHRVTLEMHTSLLAAFEQPSLRGSGFVSDHR